MTKREGLREAIAEVLAGAVSVFVQHGVCDLQDPHDAARFNAYTDRILALLREGGEPCEHTFDGPQGMVRALVCSKCHALQAVDSPPAPVEPVAEKITDRGAIQWWWPQGSSHLPVGTKLYAPAPEPEPATEASERDKKFFFFIQPDRVAGYVVSVQPENATWSKPEAIRAMDRIAARLGPRRERGGGGMSQIRSIATPTTRYALNDSHGISHFEEFSVEGQMAHVPWVRAVCFDGSCLEFNLTLVEHVVRAPESEEERDDG